MNKSCSYCNTVSPLYFQSEDYNRNISHKSFDHFRCPKCGLIFISPIPENLGDYYPETYYFVPDSTAALEVGEENERYKIEIIQRYVKQGRLLEIGPSLGYFAHLAKKSGFEAEAIEMDERCSKFLNEVAGIPTVNSNDTCAALKMLDSFDVIALWHVIEHLPNPWETLEAIGNKLNKNGILIFAAPNPDAFQFHIMGRYWPHVDAPRHLTLIPIGLLTEKLTALGMEIELITTTDRGSLGWNIFGWELFFANMSSNRYIKKALRIFGRIVGTLFSPLDRMEGRGSAYTMVFRKVT